MKRFTTDDFIAVASAIWVTILCVGFAYLYWVIGFADPRTLGAPNWLSHVGALVVFPVGWIALVFSALRGDY